MQKITPAFENELQKPVMGAAALTVRMAMADYSALAAATADGGEAHPFAQTESALARHGASPRGPVATTEPHRIRADGTAMLKGSDTNSEGWISAAFSDETGSFPTPPTLSVRFPKPVSGPGVTLVFDRFEPGCAGFTLTLWQGEAKLTETRGQTTASQWQYTGEFSGVTKITVTVSKTARPFRHARIAQLLPGLYLTFGEKAVQSASLKTAADPICRRLPGTVFQFSIINLPELCGGTAYDPENPRGLWKYADLRCPVTLMLGQQLTGSSPGWAWLPGGEFLLTGRPKADGLTVRFEAADLFCLLSREHETEIWSGKPVPLNDLFHRIIRQSEVYRLWPRDRLWQLYSNLVQVKSTAPLFRRPEKEYLQLLAHGACYPLSIDRKGRILMQDAPGSVQGSIPLLAQPGEGPKAEKNPAVERVDCPACGWLAGPKETLFQQTLQVKDGETVTLQYPFAGDISVYTEVSGTQVESEITPVYTRLHCTGTGSVTVTVTGQKPIENRCIVSAPGTAKPGSGEVETLENPLISTAEDARAVASWVRNELEKRTVYTVKTRGDIHLDPLDLVRLETKPGEWVTARVLENKLEFSGGALTGTLVLKKQ